MTPLARIQANNGRIVLVFFVALLTAWGLRLIHQSQEYVPDNIPAPDNNDLQERRRRLLEFTPQSLLEQFYRELSVNTRRLDPTGATGPRDGEAVVILYPRAQAPDALVDKLEAFVRRGGRLVVFTDTELDLLERFGLDVQRIKAGVHTAASVAVPVENAHVRKLHGPAFLEVVGKKRPLVPLAMVNERVIAGMAGVDRGTVTVVTARLADYSYIEHEDNPLFLANLVLERPRYLAPQLAPTVSRAQWADVASLAVLDYDAEVLRRLYALDYEAAQRLQEARRRWNYDSLWSLIKANPVSAGLIQLALALLVFAVSRARRLGEALPDRLARSDLPGTLDARANLFERSGAFRLAISRAVRHTNRWMGAKLGLIGEPTIEELRAGLDALNPRAAQKYAHLCQVVTNVSDGRTVADERSLAAVWNLIDGLRKELP